MCLRSTHGRIGSVHVVVKYEHFGKTYGFTHQNDRMLALYKPTWPKEKDQIISFNTGSMRQADHFSQTKKKSEKPVIDIIAFK